jgi:hypothetical protein
MEKSRKFFFIPRRIKSKKNSEPWGKVKLWDMTRKRARIRWLIKRSIKRKTPNFFLFFWFGSPTGPRQRRIFPFLHPHWGHPSIHFNLIAFLIFASCLSAFSALIFVTSESGRRQSASFDRYVLRKMLTCTADCILNFFLSLLCGISSSFHCNLCQATFFLFSFVHL